MLVDSIEPDAARVLDGRLWDTAFYVGAMEVDDESAVHWNVYSHGLSPHYRLTPKAIGLFWSGFEGSDRDEGGVAIFAATRGRSAR